MSKRREVILTLLFNGIVPWLLYIWLSGQMSSLAALSIATAVPLIENVWHLARHRKFDAFGALMLFTFVLTLVLVACGGSEKMLLVRESMVTGSVGLLFLASVGFRQPLMFHLAGRFISNPEFKGNWQYAYFRFVMRLMSAVWGILLLSEAAVRTYMAFELSTAQFLALSNFVLYGFIGAAIVWTAAYRKHSARRLAAIKQTAAMAEAATA
ncbi:VC0807 family protein [Cohnella sp. 56]|uniref:VC0807 family protein n=1 Tax=Cohnella sp. 56 TaxID=3113722 RepID=UPI0030E79E41